MEPQDATLADFADASADYMETHGFAQHGLLSRSSGRVCMVGSMVGACGAIQQHGPDSWSVIPGKRDTQKVGRLADRISAHLGLEPTGFEIPDWNDTEGRTQDEVVQALRDVAIKLRPDATGGA